MKKFFAALDQSTTGTKFIIFDQYGKEFIKSYKLHRQYYPQPGHIEHCANEIWSNATDSIKNAMAKFESHGFTKDNLVSIGVTNQRETSVLWDKTTGQPLHRAIVWNDMRTQEMCKNVIQEYDNNIDYFKEKNGLMVSPYFSLFKILWMIENDKLLKLKMKNGEISFGTMDTWMIYNLTRGKRHVTDVTNASRTFMMDIRT